MCSLFFFKQKTAYEMRISDWSSDVCSSDLSRRQRNGVASKQSLGEPPRLFFDRRRRRFRSDRLPQGGGASHQVRLRGLLRQAFQSSFDLRCKLGHLGIFGRTDNLAAGHRTRIINGNIIEQRSEEHTSELQSLMRISYAVF